MIGMIGFNPDSLLREINWIVNDMVERYRFNDVDFERLFSGLYYSWSSPNAVEFDKKYRPICTNLLDEIRNYYRDFIDDIKNAAIAIAESNGCMLHGQFENEAGVIDLINDSKLNDVPALLDNRDGNIGMDINKTLEIKTRFENGSFKWINEDVDLDSPSVLRVYDLSLYDPEGSINAAYKSRAMNITNKLNDLFNSVKNALNSAIEEEQLKIQKSSIAATDELTN